MQLLLTEIPSTFYILFSKVHAKTKFYNLDTPHYSFCVSNKYILGSGIMMNYLKLFLVTLYCLQVVVIIYNPIYVIFVDFVTLQYASSGTTSSSTSQSELLHQMHFSTTNSLEFLHYIHFTRPTLPDLEVLRQHYFNRISSLEYPN